MVKECEMEKKEEDPQSSFVSFRDKLTVCCLPTVSVISALSFLTRYPLQRKEEETKKERRPCQR
jgi:hypothetical protein